MTIPVTCTGTTSCAVTLKLTVHETLLGRKLLAVTAARSAASAKKRKKPKRTHRQVTVGSSTATIGPGSSKRIRASLNPTGRRLLAARRKLTTTVTVSQRNGRTTKVIAHPKATFTAPRRHEKK